MSLGNKTMLKNTVMGLAIAAIAATTMMAGDAEAGNRHKRLHFKFHVGHHYGQHNYGPKCWWFKRKFHKTGNPYWYRKYKRCKWQFSH